MHWLKVAQHAIHADRKDVDETQVLGVLGEYGGEHARDNGAEPLRRAFFTGKALTAGVGDYFRIADDPPLNFHGKPPFARNVLCSTSTLDGHAKSGGLTWPRKRG